MNRVNAVGIGQHGNKQCQIYILFDKIVTDRQLIDANIVDHLLMITSSAVLFLVSRSMSINDGEYLRMYLRISRGFIFPHSMESKLCHGLIMCSILRGRNGVILRMTTFLPLNVDAS